MSNRTREIFRKLYDEPAVYKLVVTVLGFANMIAVMALWQRFAPEEIDGYKLVGVLVGAMFGCAEAMLLSWYLFPERSLSPAMKRILVVGVVASIGLSVWVGSQLNDRPAPLPGSAMSPQERLDAQERHDKNVAVMEQFEQLQAARATGRQKAGGTTRPTH